MTGTTTKLHGTETYGAVTNRITFIEHINQHYDQCFDGSHELCYLHINNLKHYNRLNGIESGDEILHSVMGKLVELSNGRLVGRHAGNAVLFLVPRGMAESVITTINQMLPTFGEVEGLEAKMGSVVCLSPMTVSDCIKRAAYACESVRFDHSASYRLFEGELQHAFEKRTYVIDHLDEAIAAGEIRAWAQPIFRLLTNKICEVEVLARWMSDRYGFLRPDEFIPELERHRIIHKLDLEVIRLACAQWREAADGGIAVPFGINLSRLDFELCDIYTSIRQIMERYDVPIGSIHIEITESTLESDRGLVSEGVQRFCEAGFKVYMDDFGSGYSSLGQMARHTFDVIKIDKSMLDDVDTNQRARAVLADTVAMVKRLGMQTLCEGVETAQQLEFLRAIGCEKAQGFYLDKPLPHTDMMQRLSDQAQNEKVHEDPTDTAYYDAVGQINMLEGVSANLNGIEAAPFLGRNPVAVLEFGEDGVHVISSNYAYSNMLTRLGFESFEEFMAYTTTEATHINRHARRAAELARSTGEPQCFDFIVRDVFCQTTLQLVAHSATRQAYLSIISSVENAPQVTERTLLAGVLETSGLNFFWKDTKRRFLGANRHFLEYYGFEDVSDILGKTDEDMGWNQDSDPFRNDELDVLAGASITGAQGVCECRGQMRDIVATKRPLYSNGAIVGLVGYFVDMGPHEDS